ncbi:molybdopterin synthase catalytic subunit MoaE [Dasania sp. GY-MA-18]|uniref:Molybdopterin synthase catalytic subunit n=1 Tax=Dasania phycosphaerae TaxID=2950436 RepID=A0A9J6RLD7_9GAMM|nr:MULTISPECIES: molybdopterin synthase catalytic subunit MoaE [Dasania]MCR8922570.1 molybdopterin synthase catalytic subunit MoaE [Dasania sp. GY-MA-18]MCZ0864999.1 molybdopterin synthase catalytic subunit MoaE [Dasania phycosphaerae]MCZ0868726.1 molybdopterin synthase catalytic subunit MoaE [Dasania phycosphaerae]
MAFEVRVQTADFDVSSELALLRQHSLQTGAVVNFVGTVRDVNHGQAVASMELEHYPGMTEKAISDIVSQAKQRWQLLAATVIHRVGLLQPGEQIVLVAVSSKHRGEAFQACEFIMDFLKTQAPFWKKEQTEQGAQWVDARESDGEAAKRWQ